MPDANYLQAQLERPTSEPNGSAEGQVLSGEAFLMIRRRCDSENPQLAGAPTRFVATLQFLSTGDWDDVEAIWYIHLSAEGALITEQVMRVSYWRLVPSVDLSYVTALLCASGKIYIVGADLVYQVDEITTAWIAQGNLTGWAG